MTETLRDPGTGKSESERTRAETAARFLALLFDALAASSTPLQLAPQVTSAVAEALSGWCVLWLQDRAVGDLRIGSVSHHDPKKDSLVFRLAQGWQPLRRQDFHSKALTLTRLVNLSAEDEDQIRAIFGSDERALLAAELGADSVVVVPLTHGQRTLGLLLMAWAEPGDSRNESRLSLATEISRHVATAVAQVHRLHSSRQASQQLILTNLHLQAILDSIPQGVVVASAPDGKVVSSSRALAQLLGQPIDPKAPVDSYPTQYGFATPTGELYLPEELPWVRAARTGEPTKVQEMVIHRISGQGVTALCSASPILDDLGNTVGSVALLQDISDRKQLEMQKDEFLAMVAHELKTPLTAVKGYVQLILRFAHQRSDPSLGGREVGMLEIADRQVSRLSQLVFDLLDFSLIRMGRLDLRCVDFSLTGLARDLVAQMQVTAPDRELSLVASDDGTVQADPHRVEQLLTNLLSNAIDATDAGGHIQVRIRRKDSSVVVSVQDDGAGIPREVQERIFERYYRGPDRCHEGMGLGLYLSKGIVDAHGGRIWLESEPGRGTVFHFALRAADQ